MLSKSNKPVPPLHFWRGAGGEVEEVSSRKYQVSSLTGMRLKKKEKKAFKI